MAAAMPMPMQASMPMQPSMQPAMHPALAAAMSVPMQPLQAPAPSNNAAQVFVPFLTRVSGVVPNGPDYVANPFTTPTGMTGTAPSFTSTASESMLAASTHPSSSNAQAERAAPREQAAKSRKTPRAVFVDLSGLKNRTRAPAV